MESIVKLIVSSASMKPEDIADKLGFLPDETWFKGELRKNTTIVEKENGVVIKSLINRESSFEEHIAGIRKRLNGVESKFKDITERSGCDVQLCCVLYCESEPPLCFAKKDIKWIGSICASLDIDIYIKNR